MVEYAKPWLSIDDQVAKLRDRGVEMDSQEFAADLLRTVGYYRLTGYLYPFRESEHVLDPEGGMRVRLLDRYLPGTSIEHAAQIIAFDRRLRILLLDGLERIEVSLRMQMGYVLGRVSPFAHTDPSSFVSSFTEPTLVAETGETMSKHEQWLSRVQERQSSSDEMFVAHFRDKYDGRMPIWALTEILEMGQLVRLYNGLINSLATEIAHVYGAPSKRVLSSWLASLNYVRNVAAHHARLFNRKLVAAPRRPPSGEVPLLDHLRAEATAKEVFGLYNAVAVTAYLLRAIDPNSGWPIRLVELVDDFPATATFTTMTMGFPASWTALELWRTPDADSCSN